MEIKTELITIPQIITPQIPITEIPKTKDEEFKNAYHFIMKTFDLKHSIKPCIAVLLVYGVKENWKTLLYPIVYEVLRVTDWDREKAKEILKLYLDNSPPKKGRTFRRIENQIEYTIRKKDILKISCQFIGNYMSCLKEKCYEIRGKNRRCKVKSDLLEESFERDRERNRYLNMLFNSGLVYKLTPQAQRIYSYLVDKKVLTGYDVLYVTYPELSQIIKKKDVKIKKYLEELKQNSLILYKIGEKKGIKNINKATEIIVLDIYKSELERVEEVIDKNLF
ncbi:MAG TPA: hypothetical protein P5513_07370 [Candidatus Diapherotrites archaeon]|jgi:hypothetical protein|nr:hypothetical protein [Caldisericia bacterium]HRT03741.1 hypothetical protein [Candidatus Diapherotrites archaeon]